LGNCFDNDLKNYFSAEYHLNIDSAFSFFYTTRDNVIISWDGCSEELCNDEKKLAVRSQSKCKQDIEPDDASQPVY